MTKDRSNNAPRPSPGDGNVVVVGPTQLEELIRKVVTAALAELDNVRSPDGLLDGNTLARALCISRSTLGRLKREGLPRVKILDADRFELDECVRWLRARRGEGQ